MESFSRRAVVRLIGTAFGLMTTYHVKATVTFGAGAAKAELGWQPLDLANARYLIFDATVNGINVPAVIDTGASRSVIGTAMANQLRLTPAGTIEATAFTQGIRGTLYQVRELKIGFASLENTQVASFDLSAVEGSLVQELPLLIGQDILGRVVLEVQFPRSRGRLTQSPGTVKSGSDILSVSLSDSRLPLVPLSFGDHTASSAIVDFGSNVVCAVSEDFAAQYDLTAGRPISNTLTVGAEGESENSIFCMPRVTLGSHVLHEVPICIVKNWKFSTPVNVGWPFFTAFDIILDMRRRTLTLDADQQLIGKPFPKDRSGIGAIRQIDRIVVRHVAVNSPAQHAGLQPGDEILKLNGRRVDSNYPAAGERQGYKAAGTVMSMQLADGRAVSLVLADYF